MDRNREQEIIDRIKRGEQDAFALLVDAYKDAIFNLAFRMTGNHQDADDLAQETFFRAFRNLRHYDSRKKFFTWLYTIGLNLIRNHLKARTRQPSLQTWDESVSPGDGAGDHAAEEVTIIRAEAFDRLGRCLQELPLDLREAIVLRFYQGLSFEEIAIVSDASVSAVKMRVYRGMEKLKRLMAES